VLIADDEHDIREYLTMALDIEGWEVRTVASGNEAIAALPGFAPDVIVLDQMMPGLRGTDVARQVRSQGYRGPIVLFSGFISQEVEGELAEFGITPVSKPDNDALMRILHAFATERERGHAV
jgi:two-component system OmpR family response regulator